MNNTYFYKYPLVILVLSIIGHGIFFGVFKSDVKQVRTNALLGMHVITKEQFDYFKTVSLRIKDVLVPAFPKILSAKYPSWSDSLSIIGEDVVAKMDVDVQEGGDVPEDSKSYSFQDMQASIPYYEYSPLDYFQTINEALQAELFQGTMHRASENILMLNNGAIKMSYYVQGPISERNLNENIIPIRVSNIDKTGIKVKFRMWVTRDGRVNQVMIEEGSSFSLIDSEIVRMLKTWHFSPAYTPNASGYDWGIITVRLQK